MSPVRTPVLGNQVGLVMEADMGEVRGDVPRSLQLNPGLDVVAARTGADRDGALQIAD